MAGMLTPEEARCRRERKASTACFGDHVAEERLADSAKAQTTGVGVMSGGERIWNNQAAEP